MVIEVRLRSSRARPAKISSSDSGSSEADGSSSSRIGASLTIARAIVMRCRWPPDSVSPRSPTTVS
jgi:hypothetical protein